MSPSAKWVAMKIKPPEMNQARTARAPGTRAAVSAGLNLREGGGRVRSTGHGVGSPPVCVVDRPLVLHRRE